MCRCRYRCRKQPITASFDDEGNLLIALIGSKTATTLTVSGKKLDPSKVTAADIVGSVDAGTGKVSGLEVVQQVYPKLGMTPGILLAPGFSKDATVAAALQAKTTGINGSFRCICVCDVDSGAAGAKVYTDVKTKKEASGLNGAKAWGFVWVGLGALREVRRVVIVKQAGPPRDGRLF